MPKVLFVGLDVLAQNAELRYVMTGNIQRELDDLVHACAERIEEGLQIGIGVCDLLGEIGRWIALWRPGRPAVNTNAPCRRPHVPFENDVCPFNEIRP